MITQSATLGGNSPGSASICRNDNPLDLDRLGALASHDYWQAQPFPWFVADALIQPQAYAALQESFPAQERFQPVFGRRRAHGQQSHDRYVLQRRPGQRLPSPWQQLLKALRAPAYRRFVARMLGREDFLLHAHWHRTPSGCSVSPHCDAPWKLGSHIFYFNDATDWRPEWGGQTLILDDGGRLDCRSAPRFEDFDRAHPGPCLGNHSLIFARTPHSWHGVRPLAAPAGAIRKLFIGEFRRATPLLRARTLAGF